MPAHESSGHTPLHVLDAIARNDESLVIFSPPKARTFLSGPEVAACHVVRPFPADQPVDMTVLYSQLLLLDWEHRRH